MLLLKIVLFRKEIKNRRRIKEDNMKTKNAKKRTKAMILATAILTTGLLVTGCGSATSGGAGSLEGYYQSTQNVDFLSAYPEYTFKQATFGTESIEVYSDGTYCLTNTTSSFSGDLLFNDDGTHSEVPRGDGSMRFYGTYEKTEDSGLLTLKLSAPTSVVVGSIYSVGDTEALGYLNTQAWTDEMGSRVGGESGSMTAEEYLESVSYPEMDVIIDTSTGSFDYVNLSQGE